MKLKCRTCGEIVDMNIAKLQLVKIGNTYHCIHCRDMCFLVVEL